MPPLRSRTYRRMDQGGAQPRSWAAQRPSIRFAWVPILQREVWCSRVARSHSAMPAEPGAAQYSVEVSTWPLIRRSDYRAYGYQRFLKLPCKGVCGECARLGDLPTGWAQPEPVSNKGVNWRVVRSSPTWGAKHFGSNFLRFLLTPSPRDLAPLAQSAGLPRLRRMLLRAGPVPGRPPVWASQP